MNTIKMIDRDLLEILETGSTLATPIFAIEPGETLAELLAGLPWRYTDPTIGVAQSIFTATELPVGELAAHASACGCGVCALPGYEDSDLGELPEIDLANLSDPALATIDSTVNQGVVPTGGAGISYGDTFKLHSNPGSKLTIYLDFDGHTTTGTSWNSYWNTTSINSPAFSMDSSASFSSTELLRIQQIWARIAEYFSPFNVNVTTQDPGADALRYTGSSDTAYGIRAVITDEGGKNFGGIAYKGSFMWNVDTPVFVYSNRLSDSVKSIADAAAHEIGHSMGLDHDGRNSSEYYYGHGSGATDWAPVMGVGYNARIVQWSKGEYSGATNTQDDLSVITTRNGAVTYRADDHGNTFGTASALGGSVADGTATVEAFGIITGSGSRNDVDMFSFQLGGSGTIDFTVSPWTRAYVSGSSTPVYTASPFSMLDIALTLYDERLQQVASWNDLARTDGVLQLSGLAGGTYYLALDGVGIGNPLASTPTGYTEYGSLGQYMIRGTYSVGPGTGTGGTGDTDTGGDTGSGTGGGSLASLTLDRTSLTTSEGGTEIVMLRATPAAAGQVTVTIGGLNTAEGQLSATEVTLSAANNWSAPITLTGIEDRNAGPDIAYTLTFSANGFTAQTLDVISQDDDIAAISGGTIIGSYRSTPGSAGRTVTNQSADDGRVTNLREGLLQDGTAAIELRWEFVGLEAGDKLVQLDASGSELFRFEYSTDQATWHGFDGAIDSQRWNGDYLVRNVEGSLWVRMIDAVREGDTGMSTFALDLITVTDAGTNAVPWSDLLG